VRGVSLFYCAAWRGGPTLRPASWDVVGATPRALPAVGQGTPGAAGVRTDAPDGTGSPQHAQSAKDHLLEPGAYCVELERLEAYGAH